MTPIAHPSTPPPPIPPPPTGAVRRRPPSRALRALAALSLLAAATSTSASCASEAGETDPCEGVACTNGTCVADDSGGFVCTCDTGFVTAADDPTQCEDPCASIDCAPGTCAVAGGVAACECPAGHRPNALGSACDDVCEGVDCGGLGTCSGETGAAVCACDAGAEPVPGDPAACRSVCADIACDGHGACVVVDGAAACDCDTGYEPAAGDATSCVSVCEGVTCSDAGTCVASSGSPVCDCDTGYQPAAGDATSCVSVCEGVTCSDAGTCVASSGSPVCDCDSGYEPATGDATSCVSVCEGVTCSNAGTCLASSGSPVCDCDTGYEPATGDATSCVSVCDGVACSNAGTCVASSGSPVCDCAVGFQLHDTDPTMCVSVCEGVACSGHGDCAVVGGAAQCVCDLGYERIDGVSCVSVCDGVSCSGHGSCDNASGAAVCACDVGYENDGPTACVLAPCQTVDCSGHGTCDDASGAAVCACDTGYHRPDDDPTACASDCLLTDCSGHGSCALGANGAICACDLGYVRQNDTECVSVCDGVTCSGHGTCGNATGAPVCACDTGFENDGTTACVAIDPCEGQTCSNHGTCIAEGQSATCDCDAGYLAQGLTCVENRPTITFALRDAATGQPLAVDSIPAGTVVEIAAIENNLSPTGDNGLGLIDADVTIRSILGVAAPGQQLSTSPTNDAVVRYRPDQPGIYEITATGQTAVTGTTVTQRVRFYVGLLELDASSAFVISPRYELTSADAVRVEGIGVETHVEFVPVRFAVAGPHAVILEMDNDATPTRLLYSPRVALVTDELVELDASRTFGLSVGALGFDVEADTTYLAAISYYALCADGTSNVQPLVGAPAPDCLSGDDAIVPRGDISAGYHLTLATTAPLTVDEPALDALNDQDVPQERLEGSYMDFWWADLPADQPLFLAYDALSSGATGQPLVYIVGMNGTPWFRSLTFDSFTRAAGFPFMLASFEVPVAGRYLIYVLNNVDPAAAGLGIEYGLRVATATPLPALGVSHSTVLNASDPILHAWDDSTDGRLIELYALTLDAGQGVQITTQSGTVDWRAALIGPSSLAGFSFPNWTVVSSRGGAAGSGPGRTRFTAPSQGDYTIAFTTAGPNASGSLLFRVDDCDATPEVCEVQADTCEAPQPIGMGLVSGDTTGLTDKIDDAVCGSNSASSVSDAVHQFTAPFDGGYGFMVGGAPSLVHILTACESTASCLGFTDRVLAPESSATVPLAAGETVTVVVDGYDAAEVGPYTLEVHACADNPAACGDACTAPVGLTVGGPSVVVDTCELQSASVIADGSSCDDLTTYTTSGSNSGEDVTFGVWLDAGTTYALSATTTNLDIVLALSAWCPIDGVYSDCVAANDSAITDGTEVIVYTPTTSGTYFLVVDAWGNSCGLVNVAVELIE